MRRSKLDGLWSHLKVVYLPRHLSRETEPTFVQSLTQDITSHASNLWL